MKNLLALTLTTSMLAAVPASAAPFLFQITGDQTYTFTIDTSVQPPAASVVKNPGYFQIANVVGDYGVNGVLATATFYTEESRVQMGGLSLATPGGATFFDATSLNPATAVFTGTLAAPVFTPGTYTLLDTNGVKQGLTITALTPAVPEPATWAMMMLGFGMVGFGLRSRRKQSVRVTYA